MWSEAALAALLSERLQAPVRAAIVEAPMPVAALSSRERERFGALAGTPRAPSWLRGRAALKRLLARLGADADTADITLPNACFSLTHTAGLAVAIHVEGADGVGVDLESHRLSGRSSRRWRQAARLFATAAEAQWLGRPSGDLETALLRLWTIKEAVFKADRDNGGRALGDYALESPRRTGCAVVTGDPRRRFCYTALGEPGAMLAAALCRGSAR